MSKTWKHHRVWAKRWGTENKLLLSLLYIYNNTWTFHLCHHRHCSALSLCLSSVSVSLFTASTHSQIVSLLRQVANCEMELSSIVKAAHATSSSCAEMLNQIENHFRIFFLHSFACTSIYTIFLPIAGPGRSFAYCVEGTQQLFNAFFTLYYYGIKIIVLSKMLINDVEKWFQHSICTYSCYSFTNSSTPGWCILLVKTEQKTRQQQRRRKKRKK